MRQLILLRHAETVPGEPDHGRVLTGRGAADAVALRDVFDRLALRPEVVLVSDARRTTDTLEALTPWPAPGPEVRVLPVLYLASPAVLADQLRAVPAGCRSVLLLGHNPGLHALAWSLAAADPALAARPGLARLREGLPTAGLAVFEVDVPWAALCGPTKGGGVRLTRLMRPGDPG